MLPQPVKYQLAIFQISSFDYKLLLLVLKLAICLFSDITSEKEKKTKNPAAASFSCHVEAMPRGVGVYCNGFTLVKLPVY